jgi:hypothetical protein
VRVLRDGASIIPLEELPIMHDANLSKERYF